MASAVGELRYYSGRAVSGSLAYDLDRELRERGNLWRETVWSALQDWQILWI